MSTDIHALVGAYAVDALDDVERAAFARHLAECSACQAEVAGLTEAASMMGAAIPATPPAGLRAQVLAEIATVRPLPPVVESTVTARTAGGRPRWFQRPNVLVAAAVAVIALAGGTAVVVQQPWTDDTSQTQLTALEQVRSADDAQTYQKTLPSGGTATLVRSRELNRAVLATTDMPAAPEGSVYELWLVHDGEMVSAGLMSGGDHQLVLEGDPATATGFGITVEPDGGSPEPNLDQIVTQIDFEQA